MASRTPLRTRPSAAPPERPPSWRPWVLGAAAVAVVIGLAVLIPALDSDDPDAAPPAPPATAAPQQPGPAPSANVWHTLLGTVSAPAGWSVEPCQGDGPFLCFDDGAGAWGAELLFFPIGPDDDFWAMLTAAGAPPETTDLLATETQPAVQEAMAAWVQAQYDFYAGVAASEFQDPVEVVLDGPEAAPFGELDGVWFSVRVEGPGGEVLARTLRHAAFDGGALWMVLAEYDVRLGGEGSAPSPEALATVEPHLADIVAGLDVGLAAG